MTVKNVTPKTGEVLKLTDDDLSKRGAVLHATQVERALEVIDPPDEDELANKMAKRRLPYQQMRVHMEMAATALAAGATQKMAARYAGISVRQIKKYYQDPEFRTRIDELRQSMMSKIQGRIVKELERRTTKSEIRGMELMDVLRIFDRTVPKGQTIGGDITVNNYENIFQSILLPDSGAEGEDFPTYGDEDVSVSGGDSPIDG